MPKCKLMSSVYVLPEGETRPRVLTLSREQLKRIIEVARRKPLPWYRRFWNWILSWAR